MPRQKPTITSMDDLRAAKIEASTSLGPSPLARGATFKPQKYTAEDLAREIDHQQQYEPHGQKRRHKGAE